MLELIKSLSLASGALVMVICSAALAWPVAKVRSGNLRWLALVAVPLVLALLLTSLPIWLRSEDAAQYSAWRPLVAAVWFFAGFIGAIVTCLLLRRNLE